MGTVTDIGRVRRHRPQHRHLIGAPRPGTEDFRLWTEWIGRCLTEQVTDGVETHLTGFAELARAEGIEPGIVADHDVSQLARARAFFKVAMLLDDETSPPERPGPRLPERPGPTAA
jgi:hypothetical protein